MLAMEVFSDWKYLLSIISEKAIIKPWPQLVL